MNIEVTIKNKPSIQALKNCAKVIQRVERKRIYDELSRILTDWENQSDSSYPYTTAEDLYNMLVKIQNNWDIISSG